MNESVHLHLRQPDRPASRFRCHAHHRRRRLGLPRATATSALAVLRRAVELGVDFIDTADSYGPYVSEELIREALHPYGDVKIATKAGFLRTGPNVVGRPVDVPTTCARSARCRCADSVRSRSTSSSCTASTRRSPPTSSSACCARCSTRARSSAVGLSEVSVEADRAPRARSCRSSTVQNLYNVTNRQSEDGPGVLRARGHRLHPVVPGRRGQPRATAADRSTRSRTAARHQCRATVARVVVATLAGHAADSWHLQGGAPGGELRRGRDHPRRRDVPRRRRAARLGRTLRSARRANRVVRA